MSLPLFIAEKFVKSKKDSRFISLISIISIIGISLGVSVLIMALTILQGFEDAISDKIIKFNSHLKITGYSSKNLPDFKTIQPEIENNIGSYLESITPFISKYAIIRSKYLSEGIQLNGIQPKSDNTEIYKFIIEGKFSFDGSDKLPGIIIGKKLSDRLFIGIGDKITIFALRNDQIPSYENPPSIQQFIVSGIYESGMAEYDDLIAYIHINEAKRVFDIGEQISGYNIRLTNISKADSLRYSLQEKLRYPYYVRTVFDLHKNIFTWLDLQKEPIPIVLGLIIIVAVFNIVGTLLMLVLERTNAIGILKSLGTNRKQIIKIFLYQGAYLAFIGILFGNILALFLSLLQKEFNIISLPESVYFISSVPITIDIFNYLLVSTVAFFLSLTASWIPSYIASQIQPISAIRFK